MMGIRWLLAIIVVTLVVISLLQPASSLPQKRRTPGKNQNGKTTTSTKGVNPVVVNPAAAGSAKQTPGSTGKTTGSASIPQVAIQPPIAAGPVVTDKTKNRGRNQRMNQNGGGQQTVGAAGSASIPPVTTQPTIATGAVVTNKTKNRGRNKKMNQTGAGQQTVGGESTTLTTKKPLTPQQELKKKKRKQRSKGVLATNNGGKRPPGDDKKVTRNNRVDRKKSWATRPNKKGNKSQIKEEKNSFLKGVFNFIKNETKDLLEDLRDDLKEHLKEKAKETAMELLSNFLEGLKKDLCDCQATDCECCIDWGILGSGCAKVEVYRRNPSGMDLMIIDKNDEELASVSFTKDSLTGEEGEACFNMIPYVTDICIVPNSFEKRGKQMTANFNVTVDAFDFSSNFRIVYNNGIQIVGTKFQLISSDE